MASASYPRESAWDQLFETIDHLAAHTELVLDERVERTFADLCTEAISSGAVDAELHVDDTARWLTALLAAQTIAVGHDDRIDAIYWMIQAVTYAVAAGLVVWGHHASTNRRGATQQPVVTHR